MCAGIKSLEKNLRVIINLLNLSKEPLVNFKTLDIVFFIAIFLTNALHARARRAKKRALNEDPSSISITEVLVIMTLKEFFLTRNALKF